MKKLVAAMALAVLVGSLTARAEDSPRSPLGAMSGAQEGDWTAYSGTWQCVKLGEAQRPITALWKVEKVTDTEVLVNHAERFGPSKYYGMDTAKHTFPRKEAPSLDAILSLGGAKLTDVKVADKTVTGTYMVEKTRFVVTVTFSAEVKVTGVSKLEVKGDDGSVLLLEAKGWGDKEKTTGGKPASDVVGTGMAEGTTSDRHLACPQCGAPTDDPDVKKCPKDGTTLIRSDLLLLHTLIIELGKSKQKLPNDLDNPFARCLKADGSVDTDALDKLIADYKETLKKVELHSIDAMPANRAAGNEAAAIGALKTLSTSQAIFREGDKDRNGELDYGDLKALAKAVLIDSVLGSGKKQGYLFVCEPGRDPSDKDKDLEARCFFWYATASPEKPGETGERYFFTNQSGVIYYSKKPFEVKDKKKCEVPEGLTPVGR